MIPLGSGGEFDRVRAIVDILGDTAAGIGDDTGVIPEGDGSLVISTDATVEGVHFRRQWLSMEEIGWRATAAALSDLAAAAATPVGITVAVVVPSGEPPESLVDLMRGVGAAVRSVGAKVVGGDLTSGSRWMVTVTVFGRALRPMSRRGARAGDGIWVTGALGGARAALQAWMSGVEPDAASRSAFAHPVPRVAEGRWLAEQGATAMMDLSDGLGGDAEHLAAASGVQLDIDLESLPLDPSILEVSRQIGESAALFAAASGEDYELLLTLPAGFDGAERFREEFDVGLTRIGTVGEGSGVHATLDGVARTIGGFRHDV